MKKYSKNLALILKIVLTKLINFIIIFLLCFSFIFYDLNLQNFGTENFFKELFFKIISIYMFKTKRT